MGIRLECHVFKGMPEFEFCQLLESTLREHGGNIEWNRPGEDREYCRMHHMNDVHCLHVSQFWHGRAFGESFATRFGCPWITARIQENSHWDFTTCNGAVRVSNFSTLPQYWDESPEFISAYKGDPKAVAALWGVPVNRIERYMRNWGMTNIDDEEGTYETVLKGKAYPTDKYEYSDICQITDFIRALCGIDIEPMLAAPPQHRWINPGKPSMNP